MSWFRKISPKRELAADLRQQVMPVHGRIVDRALKITGADDWGLDDNFDFRFDVMVFLISVVLHNLHHAGKKSESKISPLFSQMLWDVTFEGFEESLRDRGVTDVRMAARMRKLLQNAMGRRNAYLDAWQSQDNDVAIRIVVARNVFNGAQTTDPRLNRFLANLPGFVESVLPADLQVD